jgi:DNA-binding transcriptional LysR family regulator
MARKPEPDRYRSVIARLKLRHLRLIEAIVEAKGVSAAAESLHISQPAVSKGLREVEDILGVSLFERGPSGLTLTHYGRAVLAHGQVIQSEIRHVTDEIEALSSGVTGVVAIGALLVSQPSLLPRALALLRERDVAAVARVVDGRQEELMAALRAGELDVLVGRLPAVEQSERLVQEVLLYEPMVVVSGSRNPLAAQRRVGYRELAQADWIFPSPESTVYSQIMQLFTQHGLSRPRSYVQSVSFLMTRTLMVDNGMLAALPRSVVARDVESGLLRVLPVRFPHEPLAVGITRQGGRRLSALAAVTIQCLREAAKSFASQSEGAGAAPPAPGRRRTLRQSAAAGRE